MYCKKCGHILQPNDIFCTFCGNPRPKDAAEPEPEPRHSTDPYPLPRQPLPPVQKPDFNRPPYLYVDPLPNDFIQKKNEKKENRQRKILLGILVGLVVLVFAVIILLAVNLVKRRNSPEADSGSDMAYQAQQEETQENIWAEEAQANTGEANSQEEEWPEALLEEEAESHEDNDGLVFADSDRRYLERWELEDLSQQELSLARNEIYARKGRMFNSQELQSYFENTSWYEPMYTPEEFDSLGQDTILNEYELANKDLIVEVEEEKGYR